MTYLNKINLMPALQCWCDVVFEESWEQMTLMNATQLLCDALESVARVREANNPGPRELPEFVSEALQIRQKLVDLSGRYLWHTFTDSDVDARCDIEWDVHKLQQAIDPTHVIPSDVEPAFVLAHTFPAPEMED